MAHLYEVKTSNGIFDVTVDKHHAHMTTAEFEKVLFQAIAGLGQAVAAGLILHHYTYRGVK